MSAEWTARAQVAIDLPARGRPRAAVNPYHPDQAVMEVQQLTLTYAPQGDGRWLLAQAWGHGYEIRLDGTIGRRPAKRKWENFEPVASVPWDWPDGDFAPRWLLDMADRYRPHGTVRFPKPAAR